MLARYYIDNSLRLMFRQIGLSCHSDVSTNPFDWPWRTRAVHISLYLSRITSPNFYSLSLVIGLVQDIPSRHENIMLGKASIAAVTTHTNSYGQVFKCLVILHR